MAQPKRKDKSDEVEGSPVAVAAVDGPADTEWQLPSKLPRNSLLMVIGTIALFNLPLIHYFIFRSAPDAPLAVPYRQDFSSPEAVKDFWSSGGQWRVEDGWMLSPGVKNNPLWLKAKLPQNVAVEFDVKSLSPEGDIKCEIFGDGSDHASGYVLIHGGWNNSLSIIARRDEHGQPLSALMAEAQRRVVELKKPAGLVESGAFTADTRMRVEANPYPVQMGKTYHWRIERRGSTIVWFIDGNEFMRFDDPLPLVGKSHDRFGFSSWEAQLYFDNLTVTPL